jgi:gamma-glutamylcyclotransferase (GGCT)/AIG2-like uncharacterized protein YtfP
MTEYIFAYGTLQQEETQKTAIGRVIEKPIRAYAKGSVRSVRVNGYSYNIFYPDIFANFVPGLLLAVEPEELSRIDKFETDLYRRMEINVFRQDGKPHEISKAWVYAANPKQVDELRGRRLRQSDLF